MKRIWSFCLAIGIVLLFSQFSAASLLMPKFAWDAPTEGELPTGYILKWGNTSGKYGIELDTKSKDTTFTLPQALQLSTDYYFIVCAYNEDGRSGYSNEVWYNTDFYSRFNKETRTLSHLFTIENLQRHNPCSADNKRMGEPAIAVPPHEPVATRNESYKLFRV